MIANAYLESLGFKTVDPKAEPCLLERTKPWQDNDWSLAFFASEGRIRLQVSEPGRGPGTEDSPQDSHIQDMADAIFGRAFEAQASDIHLEPQESYLQVRYRLDGRLVNVDRISKERQNHLMAHLKIRAGMDIAEKRRPQDGRFFLEWLGKKTDLRVSTVPTQYGEKMVLRILDLSRVPLDFDRLGLAGNRKKIVTNCIKAPYGMILVTGPTGSGKTTSLYTMLKTIHNPTINILTIEDPVEYQIAGVNQTQVKSEIGVTFASALRSFLRQDPNVIMVGEIRDEETAELATRAALTGHLVLSTLHANDALGAIPRILDMGVAPHLLSSCLKMVMAQRLVRKLCKSCALAVADVSHWPAAWGESKPYWAPVGCDQCFQTGYKGRMGLYEVLEVNRDLLSAINGQAGPTRYFELARTQGMETLLETAMSAIASGDTSIEEVLREVHGA